MAPILILTKFRKKNSSSQNFQCKILVFWLKFKIKNFMFYFEERIFWSQRKIKDTWQASVQWVLQERPNTAGLPCVWLKGLCSLLWVWTLLCLKTHTCSNVLKIFSNYCIWPDPLKKELGAEVCWGWWGCGYPHSSWLWLDELCITHLPCGVHSRGRAVWAMPGCFSTCRDDDQLYVEISLSCLA